ncbi:MAG: acetyl-CoA carboxylase biotin carboxyl carrier protein [Candidatus Binatia bacterium]
MARLPRVMGRTGKREAPAPSSGATSDAIRVSDVAALIRLMDENQLVEIEVESAGSKIRLVKDRGRPGADATVASADAAGAPVAHVAAPDRALDHCKAIISPMVGTFFRAPSPEAPPFVEAGTVVEKGDTLCIIEAMKMMNEIEAEFRGRVARVVAENGQTVEYGESLFLIEPL